MSTAPSHVHRKLWEERSVVVALILAVLVPGLGHLFQGRIVKGLIYLVGILGLFLWGVKLGEGIVVYNLPDRGTSRRITLHYAAQLGAGVIAYPAFWQQKRVLSNSNQPLKQLEQPLSAPFSGRLVTSESDKQSGNLEGTINLKPETGQYGPETQGTFTGTLDGKPIELTLAGNFFLDRPISAGFRRTLKCGVVGDRDTIPGSGRYITGWIPRPIKDGYGVPPTLEQLQEVTGRLGKLHELALVFTWIAGLLNVLAIWDCIQGPAYGFGDETLNPVSEPPPVETEATAAPSASIDSSATPA